MNNLEREAIALRDMLLALPDSTEKTIALRAVRQALSLMSRDLISASDAFYRARRFYHQALNSNRKAS